MPQIIIPAMRAPGSYTIADATFHDVKSASRSLALAFEQDAVIQYFFQESPLGLLKEAEEFFSLLLRVRIALNMPRLVARTGGEVVGCAMGYGLRRPEWLAEHDNEWLEIAARVPGIEKRMQVYEGQSEQFKPKDDHYYLGVLGVAPICQGLGIGSKLLKSFHEMAAQEGPSLGVYLETANPASMSFYQSQGYRCVGTGRIGTNELWCMHWRPMQVL